MQLGVSLFENFEKACENYSNAVNSDNKEENFNNNSNAGKGMAAGLLLFIVLLILALIGVWIWNLVVLIKYKDELPPNVFTTCVILTVLGVVTSIPLHIISLIMIYSSRKKASK